MDIRQSTVRRRLVLAVFVIGFFTEATASWAAEPAGDRGALVQPLKIAKPLLASWNFDEPFGGTVCRDASGNRFDASTEGHWPAGLQRTPGVFGTAMTFAGHHNLHASAKLLPSALEKVSFSAWVQPTAFDKYNEIFRKEDGDSRVLFSFQDEFTHLTLGLNVNGYVECDAPIQPGQVLDGQWHHVAATFDGRAFRVYLDGRQIGSLERPGTISAGGSAVGCIGSSSGGECFQGSIDELRVYRDALTASEVAALHQNGITALARMTENVAADEPKVDRPLVAHWTFNERAGSALHDVSGNPALEVRAAAGVPRTKGIHGNALRLQGEHALMLKGLPDADLSKITFSAWVQPLNLQGYREIFRQECPNRLLFSFQQDGRVLSLGLNVGGYEECDAEINPGRVLDGQWHHVAGTFDGQFYRVYLDGREVGSLNRPGKIAIQPDAPAFVGSSSGRGEHFQGSLDDLRIYSDALSAADVATLYRGGLNALEQSSKELRRLADSVYAARNTFAQSFTGTRKNIVEKGLTLDRDLAGVLLARLQSKFPEDYESFGNWTESSPLEYLVSGDGEFLQQRAGRLVDLLLEYRPLTERQWKGQTPEQLRNWKEADAIQQRFEKLKAQGEAVRFSPEWIDLMFEAGRRIQFRPVVSERVAPYVPPATPPTRALSGTEAEEFLHQDWLHQAGRKPTLERIQSEIQWTRDIIQRLVNSRPGKTDFSRELTQLKELETLSKAKPTTVAACQDLYFRVRAVKRHVMFKNPVLDFDKLLLVDMPFPQGSEWRHETRHRLGYMAVPGGRLLVFDGLSPAGKPRQLAPQLPLHGSFWRPDLSFDGKRVVFCFKPHNEKSFHLYEINVDGSGLVQLTDGPYDDLDPVYLPDGHILFSTTRGHTYVRCMPPTNAFVLARCDRDGKNIYLVSYNNEPDYLPSVMNDGRVIYTRWEYTDKPLWRAQKLWTMNPDGTQLSTFWGNQSVWPDLLKDARAIPGSRRVMFTGSAHHNWFAGSVGIIDPDKGFNFPDGLTKVTADTIWPESGNGPVDPVESPRYHPSGNYAAYYSPYPLSERDFLVSAERDGKFVLYLMDVDGNRELIYEGVNNVFYAQPLRARKTPPTIADRVAWPDRKERLEPKRGVIFSGNIYYGAPAELKGKAKFLRVLHIDPKTYTYWHKRPYISTGPVVSAVQSEGVKRVLGTVPIEDDGSVAFYVPPSKAVHFQLLDSRGRALQTMRSFVGVMPGERRGCLGCHESHSRSPRLGDQPLALLKEPRTIIPPPWNDVTVSYPRYVQPVLDKYCGKCHQGDGEARKVLDLTERPSSPVFPEPYHTLIGRPSWGRPYTKPEQPPPGFGIADTIMVEAYSTVDPAAYVTPKPMTFLSYKSRLIEMCSNGKHYGVKVDPISLERLVLWVDTMCPYCGEEEIQAIPDPVFQGVDWLAVRPRVQTAPKIVRPGPVD